MNLTNETSGAGRHGGREDGGRADGPADGRTDGRTDGRMHRRRSAGKGVRTMRRGPVAEASRAGHRRSNV